MQPAPSNHLQQTAEPAPRTRSGLRKTLKGYWEQLKAGDPDPVHEARKLTRRAQAELRVAGAGKGVSRQWRDLRRAAAALRDHDVAGQHLAEALRELGAAPTYVRRFEQLWQARREELLRRTRWPKRPVGYDLPSGWTDRAHKLLSRDGRALQEAGEALVQAPASEDAESSEAWHEWRKNLKQYRYTLELVGEVPGPLKRVLDSLGRLQDAEVILELLESDHKLLPAYRTRLREREAAARLQAKSEVRREFSALAKVFAGPVR
ncbi:CHAD domain-containing protein [Deinococcus lacus]|uniref:CHAD domain-containing protein n=1 Tax=Deinococcus lacus TaxID=392561 RepID=A0ABW1YCX7_9DEIO